MKTTKVIGDLTQAHIDQLATTAAEAKLKEAGIELRARKNNQLRSRIDAAFARFGFKISNSRKSVSANGRAVAQVVGDVRIASAAASHLQPLAGSGLLGKQAVACAIALQRCRDNADEIQTAARWNNLDKSPTVLTDFCDRNSATTIDFGY